MTLTVEDDFAAFVAARWAELEALAVVTTLDPVSAREATTHALGRLRSGWADAVEDGTPTLRTRRAVLERSLHLASSAARRGPEPARARPGSARRGFLDVDLGDEGAVADALWQCLCRATASERAVLACALVCEVDTGEAAHLLGMPVEEVEGHDRSLRGQLAGAHEAGRATIGAPPADWALEDDLRSLVDDLVEESPDPPDPAGLVAAEAAGVRRRTVVLAGAAVLTTAVAGWSVVRAIGDDSSSASGGTTVGPTSGVWASTQEWPARGGLASDVGMQGLVLSRTSSGSRLVYADDVGDRRVVIAVPVSTPSDPDGSEIRAWLGARGALPESMEEMPLPWSFIAGVGDVVALHLPQGGGGSALVVLARPTVESAQVSRFVDPTPEGTVVRAWVPMPLTEGVGVDLSERAPSAAMRVRVAGYDGPPANPSQPWFDTALSGDLTGDLTETLDMISELVASATGDRRGAVTSTVTNASIASGSILDPEVISATGGDGRVVTVATRTPGGALLRSVLATDDGRSGSGPQVLELVSLIPADQLDAPVLVRLYDSGPDTGRFLVVARDGARAQLLATSPNAYPVSKVTPFKGDTAVVSVVNADDAAAFRLIVKDAKKRETYRGVPSTGTDLFDLWTLRLD